MSNIPAASIVTILGAPFSVASFRNAHAAFSEGPRVVKQRDGVPKSEQVRRAIAEWLERKGVTEKAGRRRAVTRKRPQARHPA